jgi:hypothetical protein
MTKQELGRNIVIGVILATLTTTAVVTVVFYALPESPKLAEKISRFIFIAFLCVALYFRVNLVRWVLGLLFGLSGIGLLRGGTAYLDLGRGLPPLIVGSIYLASGVVLLFVPAVRAYFKPATKINPAVPSKPRN